MRKLFWKVAKREGIQFDGQFDWVQFKGEKPSGDVDPTMGIDRNIPSGNGDSGSKSASAE